MGRKPRVQRTPEEKWQIVQEGIKSGNVSETCRDGIRGQTECSLELWALLECVLLEIKVSENVPSVPVPPYGFLQLCSRTSAPQRNARNGSWID